MQMQIGFESFDGDNGAAGCNLEPTTQGGLVSKHSLRRRKLYTSDAAKGEFDRNVWSVRPEKHCRLPCIMLYNK